MKRKEVMELVKDIEQRFPVDEWIVNGVHLWPFLRVQLAFKLDDSLNGSKNKTEPDHKSTRKTIDTLKKIKAKLLKPLTFLKKRYNYKLTDKKIKSKKSQALFLTYSHYRAYFLNEWYSRFTDPLIDRAAENNIETLTFEFASYVPYQNNRHKENQVIELNNYLITKIELLKKSYKLDNNKLDSYSDFQELVYNKTTNLDKEFLNKANILDEFTRLIIIKDIFKEIIIKTQSKVVFVVNYYDIKGMAICAACDELGIPSVDIQHGIQGNIHIAYGNWSKVPKEGFKTLPSVFWNWNQSQAQYIDKWAARNIKHQTFVGGNPWNQMFKSVSSNLDNSSKSDINALKINDTNAVYILFTLQPMGDDLIPDFFFDIYKNSPQNWQWWFRLHPRQSLNDPIVKLLTDKYNVPLSKIKLVSEYPLNLILEHTNLHITQFSSVVLEAETFGVPSICIHPNSLDMFDEQIHNGTALYCPENSEDLKKYIYHYLNFQIQSQDKYFNYQEKFDKLLLDYEVRPNL